MINEVLFCPATYQLDVQKHKAVIEIYWWESSYRLKGCSLITTFDSVYHEYFTVKQNLFLRRKFFLSQMHGILWMHDFVLDSGIALFSDDLMVDYIVAWGTKSRGPNGALHNSAVVSGMWSNTDGFVELVSKDLAGG